MTRFRFLAYMLMILIQTGCQAVVPSGSGQPSASPSVSVPYPAVPDLSKAEVDKKLEIRSLIPVQASPDGQWLLLENQTEQRVTYKGQKTYHSRWLDSGWEVLHVPTGKLKKLSLNTLNNWRWMGHGLLWDQGRIVYFSTENPRQLVALDPVSGAQEVLARPAVADEVFSLMAIRGDHYYFTSSGGGRPVTLRRYNRTSGQTDSLPSPAYGDRYGEMSVQVRPDESALFLRLSKSAAYKGEYPFQLTQVRETINANQVSPQPQPSTTPTPLEDVFRVDAEGQIQPIPTLLDRTGPVELSPDGQHLLGDSNGQLEVVDTRSLVQVFKAPGESQGWLDASHPVGLERAQTGDALVIHSLTGEPAQRLRLDGQFASLQMHQGHLYVHTSTLAGEATAYGFWRYKRLASGEFGPAQRLGQLASLKPSVMTLWVPGQEHPPFWTCYGEQQADGLSRVWTAEADGELKEIYSEQSIKPGNFVFDLQSNQWKHVGAYPEPQA